MYKYFLRKLLFLLEPELAHAVVFSFLKIPGISQLLSEIYSFERPNLMRSVFGLSFKNPVGLAAGLDKNGTHIHQLAALGFGFLEIGTVTPRPQSGNPKPRLFRLPKDQALINRMGFNNDGVQVIKERLKRRPRDIIIGANIGKNKNTPNERAVEDYEYCFRELHEYADYFAVNVSSPNTPGLRELQDKSSLLQILTRLQQVNREFPAPRPVLLKIAPDLSDAQLNDIIGIVMQTDIAGVIATNTTVSRDKLKTAGVEKFGAGGLSGKPLAHRATEVIFHLREQSAGAIPIIGVGGIHSPQDALEKMQAGASLVQLYTGFIYEGPALIKKIKKAVTAGIRHKAQVIQK